MRNLNPNLKILKPIQFNSFCLQFDDWMLLKECRELSEKFFWTKQNDTRLKFNPDLALTGLQPTEPWVLMSSQEKLKTMLAQNFSEYNNGGSSRFVSYTHLYGIVLDVKVTGGSSEVCWVKVAGSLIKPDHLCFVQMTRCVCDQVSPMLMQIGIFLCKTHVKMT